MEGKEGLEKILSKDELKALFELMEMPGWYLLEKVNKAFMADWIEQTASLDVGNMTDDELVRKVRDRKGQIKGITLFLAYLKKKKAFVEKKLLLEQK